MRVDLDVGLLLSPARGVKLTFVSVLEVLLDCSTCRRTGRVVVFEEPFKLGRCDPAGHDFAGKIGPCQVTSTGLWTKTYACVIPLSYEYEPFEDTQDPDRVASEFPLWARVSFGVTCAACGRTDLQSTQNNIPRPCSRACACGSVLYTETEMLPTFTPHEHPAPVRRSSGIASTLRQALLG
jgi:hypothetical protein